MWYHWNTFRGSWGIRHPQLHRWLHMRRLQHWLHSRVPRWAWRRGTLRVGITQQNRCSLSPWTDLAFLWAGVPLEQVSRHTVATTDASSKGRGTTSNGQAASGLWTRPPTALAHQLPRAVGTALSLSAVPATAVRQTVGFSELIFSRDSTSLAHSSEKGLPFSGARHHMAPASRSVEPPCVAPGWDAADLSGLPPAVVETITQARAPSTRQTYALKRSLFANWCSSHREDPRRCTIGVVLYFLQERLERRLSPSTLKCMWPLSRPTTMQWTAGPWDQWWTKYTDQVLE